MKAQITSVSINKLGSVIDSISYSCVPSGMPLYNVYGTVTGTLSPTGGDSVTVKFFFGDGTSETYKSRIDTGKNFYAYKYLPKTYTVAGSYTTKVVVTAASGVKDSMISTPFTVSASTGIVKTKFYSSAGFDTTKPLCKLPIEYYYMLRASVDSGCLSIVDTAFININFGDGSDSTFKITILPGSTWYGPLSSSKHVYSLAGAYTPRTTVSFAFSTAKDTAYLTPFTLSDSCATIKGVLYLDDNKNCVKNTGESGVWYVPIRVINAVTGDTSYAYKLSDTAGNYSLDLPAGTYNIYPMVNRTYFGWSYSSKGDTLKPTCPTSGSATLTVAPMTSYTRDFAYECTPVSSFDASVSVSSNCYVPGDTSVMKVWAGDWWKVYFYNCLSLTSTVTLTLDSKLNYTGHLDGKAPTSIVGKVISWNLSGKDLAYFNSRVKVGVATTATLGDTLRSTAYVAPATGVTDPVTTNNTYVYSREVVSAFDPNMKEASPSGKGKEGFIGKNTAMTYTIHFQNTGTAPARNITVIDTLESDLASSSFHMLTSTHNATVYQEGRIVKFRFNNIYLPDSGSNYYGSMGSVTFGILPVRDLVAGTEIKNRAGIYFDYNDPIITNYALNTIDNTTNIQYINSGNLIATIYPNPANTELNIKVDNNINYSVNMIDMMGRTVAFENSTNGLVVIPTQNLGSGTYLVYIRDEKGNQLSAKILVKH
ncbi:MAG: T9SS type A sorting domain-containing protein [Bacteroidota bacterium]